MNFAAILLFFQLLAVATTNISFCSGSSDPVHGRRHLRSIHENYEESKLSGTGGIKKLPWKNLEYLDIRSNLLEGAVPVPPPNMKVFMIANNKFAGEIPQLICNMSNIQVLDLSNNSLTGTIPECIGNFSNTLEVLDLRQNSFHGTIPSTFPKSNVLRTLNFNGNELVGTVPRSLLHCAKLQVLDFGNNKINDTFPYWLGTLPDLKVLVLRSNQFHGSLEYKTNSSFSNLRIFDLSNNHFSGSFPTKYFENMKGMMDAEDTAERKYMGENSYYEDSVTLTIKRLEVKLEKILTIFTTIDFSKNRFHGEIPELIGNLHSLRLLNLSQNILGGNIPSSLGNLKCLESLDLSSNQLQGKIPRQLTSMTFLGTLNLSQNKLTGTIPEGNQFDTFSSDSYSGNLGLCGFPLSNNCSGGGQPQSSLTLDNDTVSENGFGWKVVLMGYGCGMAFGIIIGSALISNGKPEWVVRIVEGKHRRNKRQNKKGKGRRNY